MSLTTLNNFIALFRWGRWYTWSWMHCRISRPIVVFRQLKCLITRIPLKKKKRMAFIFMLVGKRKYLMQICIWNGGLLNWRIMVSNSPAILILNVFMLETFLETLVFRLNFVSLHHITDIMVLFECQSDLKRKCVSLCVVRRWRQLFLSLKICTSCFFFLLKEKGYNFNEA